MPTFDFRCGKCSAVFEFHRPFGSKARPACPACKSKRTEKLLSPPSVQFKGTGFYKTDSIKTDGAKARHDGAKSRPVDGSAPPAAPPPKQEKPAADSPPKEPQKAV